MRTVNPLPVILILACIVVPGCDNQQAATTDKTLPARKSSEGHAQMQYTITERDAFAVMGISTRIKKSEENDENYTEIWKQFESYEDRIKPLSINWWYYGVNFATKQQDTIDYLAGMTVRENAVPPDNRLVIRKVPAARYAVFECPYTEIGRTYQNIFGNWLPNSRYTLDADACCFEQYHPRNRQQRDVLINIPIKSR